MNIPFDTWAVFVAGATVGAFGMLLFWLILSGSFSEGENIESE